MAVTMFKRVFVVLAFVAFELQYFTAEVVVSSLETSTVTNVLLPSSAPPSSTFQNQPNSSTSKIKKLPFHKCCDLGQVYHSYSAGIESSQCLNSSVDRRPSSLLLESSQHLLWTTDKNPLPYSDEDFEFVTGFPVNCDRESLGYFDPDENLANHFYLTGTGQMVIPHRFWFFNSKDYCIEEFVMDENFNKTSRTVYFCDDDLKTFPSTAINKDGKLQLDFVDLTIPSALSSISGKTVVQKCCDLNQVYSIQNQKCIVYKQELETNFFEDLRTRENDTVFFRIGFPTCFYISNTNKFQLTSSGSLQVERKNGQELNGQLFSADNYCVDNFVTTEFVGLPEVIMHALFCSDQPPELPETSAPIDSGPTQENSSEELKKYNVPKCCPSGSVIVEGACQPLGLIDEILDAESIVTNALSFFLQRNYNISDNVMLLFNSSVSFENECGFDLRSSFQPTKANETESGKKTKFMFFAENNRLLLSRHTYIENLWDFKQKLPFCVDLQLSRNSTQAVYNEHIYNCLPNYRVSKHYPILLGISSAALLATFVIYFIVPTSGSAKLIVFMRSASTRNNIVPTMAMMLTGRILLCHVFTLAVTFISLAISQEGRPSETSCIISGYVTYVASIASFSWLTVYCFDYCRIFRGSFKVSNEILFLPYSLFGWGSPLLALVVTSVVQFQSTYYGISGTFNPNMGLVNCWFADGTASLIFFYIPVSLLMFLNVIFFLSLLFNPNLMNCWKKNRTTPLRNNLNSTKESKEKQDIKMAVKLFFITGIPWVFEIVAWLPVYVPDVLPILRDNSKYVLEISNLLNSLRGVMIFVIFIVLQRNVRRNLWHCLKRLFLSKDKTKMNSHSRENVGSTSASTQQSTVASVGRLSFLISPVMLSLSATSEDEENNTRKQSKLDEVTYL